MSQEKCEHKFVFLRSEGYVNKNRNTASYYLTDFFFCEKCLIENTIIREEHDLSIYSPKPAWALGITRVREVNH